MLYDPFGNYAFRYKVTQFAIHDVKGELFLFTVSSCYELAAIHYVYRNFCICAYRGL